MKRLEKALQILHQSGKIGLKELTGNDVLLSAVERNFQVAIECILDIGNHIIAEKGFESPDDNEDIIRILGDEGVLPPDFAGSIKGMAGFRNILVHGYTKVDYELLYDYLARRLNDLREFAGHISAYLDKEGYK
ncbi:hypothetical protein BMS3Abin10_01060 [bacterium BMS3Abin10]|nr:hypothetical protein BMS3Abin10_01060 [bacterium BMS3Abin10]GBE38907.1 hypothetical protein BMS3Bbin08_01524 [bacterium BMS3Bbin08]